MTIQTMLRVGWISVRRDPVVLAMTFLLPIMFFSIFALVFSNQRDPTSRVRVAVVDEDQTDFSGRLVAALEAEGALRVTRTRGTGDETRPITRQDAEELIKDGALSVAVVLPKGIGNTPLLFGGATESQVKVQVLADVADPIAPQVVTGLLQKVAFTATPVAMATEGMSMFQRFAGPLTSSQQQAFDTWTQSGGQIPGSADGASPVGLAIETVNVLQPEGGNTSMVSFYAAGIGVMFLLFSCSGAGGTLLEEEESGTLDRLIGSRAGMTGVLVGKWAFIALMGMVQLTVMFTWGAIVFGLPLLDHIPGFVIMTTATAMAAAAFGLVLATLARSRAQLSGLSTIIILAMSALGGSMFPRFLMSDTMQKMGLVTFNGWALDGYLKVFWYDAALWQLWPQVAVLAGLACVFFLTARRLARRWESV